MSKYTSQLRYICEAQSGFTPAQLESKTIDEIITAARANIFNFNFPFYDETKRTEFCEKILFHFYMREIGQETYGLWKYYLTKTLRDIMPLYNQLYASAELEFNPFHDVDYSKQHAGQFAGNKQTTGTSQYASETDGTTTDNSETETSGSGAMTGTSGTQRAKDTQDQEITNTTSENDGTGSRTLSGTKTGSNQYSKTTVSRDAYSDTPQTSVLGVEGDGSGSPTNNVSDNYYLTNYRKITGSETGSGSSTETNSETENTTTHNEGVGNSTTAKNGHETETINGTTGENTTSTGHTETAANGTTHDTTAASTNTSGSETTANSDNYTDRISGKMGTTSYSQMLLEYRETMINIDKMIYDELEVCFMQLY